MVRTRKSRQKHFIVTKKLLEFSHELGNCLFFEINAFFPLIVLWVSSVHQFRDFIFQAILSAIQTLLMCALIDSSLVPRSFELSASAMCFYWSTFQLSRSSAIRLATKISLFFYRYDSIVVELPISQFTIKLRRMNFCVPF